MSTTRLADARLLVLSIVLSGGIFAVDLSLPFGVAAGVPYVIVVLASLWSPRRRDTYLAAGAGTALTALGYFLSAPGGIAWMVLTNRILALFAIWSAAGLILQRKRADAAQRDAHDLLEIRVAERTAQLGQANEALRAKEARLRLTLEQIPASLWTTDTELRFTSTRGSGLRAQNLKSGDLVGVTLFEHFGTEDREFPPIAAHLRALRGEAVDYEFSNCGMTFQVHVQPLRHANRKIAGCIALALNISEQKRDEQALRLSERRYRELIDALPHGIEECDLNGTITFSSPGNDRLKGYDLGEVAGHKIWDCSVSEEAARGLQRWLRRLVSEQPAPTPWIGQIKLRDGRLLDVQVDWNYKHADDGRLTGLVSVITDITARRCAEAQVHKHQEELAHLSRLSTMGEMATGLAHELNQPLASIVNYTSGCVQRIRAGQPDLQELVAVLNDASSEAQRAGEIIKRIRRFVQKREPARTTIDIAELIRQVLDLMRSDLQRQSIQTRLEVEERMPTLQGDRIQLQQVLLNLLRNSVEAMNGTETKHRHLTVGAATNNGDSVTLFVCDTGCGLGEVDPDRVFEAFYTTRKDGTGMGLAISRTIIEAHGGRLWVTDNADGGCTFHFSLPQHTELTGV